MLYKKDFDFLLKSIDLKIKRLDREIENADSKIRRDLDIIIFQTQAKSKKGRINLSLEDYEKQVEHMKKVYAKALQNGKRKLIELREQLELVRESV